MISVIIPVYNEERNIAPLFERLYPILKGVESGAVKKNGGYEVLFIDDGSRDGTAREIEKLRRKDKNVKLLCFSRNFGKSAAMQAGFDEAKGEILILMDGDLQDIPEEIPKFLAAIKNADVVVGWRYYREDRTTKRLASRIFNSLSGFITGLRIHDANCGFKALRKEVAKNLELYGEMHRYLPALAYVKGYKVSEIKIRHAPRLYGRSKYGLSRMWKGFFDLLTVKFLSSFAKRPFHFFGGFGILSFLLGFIIGAWLFAIWLLTGTIGGHTPAAILSMLLLILGLQLISLGLIGEMIAATKARDRVYEIKRRV